jgi:uncharacterized protein (TIGR03086 family)
MADDHGSRDVRTLLIAGRDREAADRGAGRGAVPAPRQQAEIPTDGGTMDPLRQFDELGPVLGGVIGGIGPDQLDLPTPCGEFTVRDVLEHMIGGATMFASAYRGDAPAAAVTDDPIAAVQTALGDLGAAITTPGALDQTIEAPFGAIDGESFARFIVLDGLVHGWDMATATGQAYDPPPELVAAVDGFAHQVVDGLRDSPAFGPAVAPPSGCTPIEALAAYTGRSVPTTA